MKIKSYEGEEKNVNCIGCDLQRGSIQTSSGLIYGGDFFEIRQDYELPIEGFFIISSKRHIVGFADFTEKEGAEFIHILCKLRKIMRDKLKIKFVKIYMDEKIIENKESPSHFHIGILPQHKWMERFDSIRELFKYAKENMTSRKDLNKINETARKVKAYMKK